ncbi:MAG TPA: DUF3048 domain-containing protein [Candidatus Saccharimonadales bacterium]|nr:DUF3048 domain-containing protein [Candidatus Saccharimonadales bacterium]
MDKIRSKLKRLLRTRRRKLIAGSILALVLLAIVLFFVFFNNKEEPEPTPVQKQVYRSQLTGLEVSKEDSERPVLGVMIENSPSARPQRGLSSAEIVFETVTEGGITRYLALYQTAEPKKIEPVRSVRPAFARWMNGFDASIAHVGGSVEGLSLIKQLHSKDLDQFFHTGPYYRDSNRPAPHNMVAVVKGLRDLQKQLGYDKKSRFADIPRSDDNPAQTPKATIVTIDFSSPDYAVQFKYDKKTNSYKRFLAGQAHKDAVTGKQISVKNLIVLKVRGSDSNSLKTIGKGTAFVFKDGKVIKAKWKQGSAYSRVEIIGPDGEEIPLNRGSTWFAGVPSSGSVSF